MISWRVLNVLAAVLLQTGPCRAAGAGPASPLKEVRLAVWNQADQPTRLKVSIDGTVILDEVLRAAGKRADSVVRRVVQLKPGKHTAVAWDVTGKLEARRTFRLVGSVELRVVARGNLLTLSAEDKPSR